MLRDYQLEVFRQALDALAEGKNPLIVLPPGGGKTHILEALMRESQSAIGLAHRIELVRKLQGLFSGECGMIWSRTPIRLDLPYQVGTVQTVIKRLDGLEISPALVVVDEAHHAPAPSYKTILSTFDVPYVGVTATPWRMDNRKLSDLFDVLIEGPSVSTLTENGWLMPFEVFTSAAIDSSDVPIVAGEYEPIEAARAAIKITADAVQEWRANADGRQTIVYTVGTKHSEHVLLAYQAAGVKAAMISAKDSDRAKKISAFEAREITVLINCEIAIEGIDVPACECVQILRLTRSLRIYDQMVGRLLRPSGRLGIVLDHAQTWQRFGYPFEGRKWTLDGGDFAGAEVKVCPKCGRLNRSDTEACECGHIFSGRSREVITIPETINGSLQRVDSLTRFSHLRGEVAERLLDRQSIGRISADLNVPQTFVKNVRQELGLTQRRSTEEQREQVIALFEQGVSVDEISAQTGCSRAQIWGILRREGQPLRGKNPDNAVKDQALALIEQGVTYPEIAKQLNVGRSTIQAWAAAAGHRRARNNTLTTAQIAELIRNGKTQAEIKQLGATADLIQKAIAEHGVRKRQPRPILEKPCPHCACTEAKLVGKTRQGNKLQYVCLNCRRKFSEPITEE